MKLELIDRDPLDGISLGDEVNPDRQQFVPIETIEKVIGEATDTEFKLVIALSRFAGIRIPSEMVDLKWEDVNWEKSLLQVKDSKRGVLRQVPIFPELKPYFG